MWSVDKNLLPELNGRVGSLDGLRALSIAMVLFSHALHSCNFPSVPSWINWFFNGPFGVKIFFVISGFIITLLLLKEENADGEFSIRNFYIRRAFRIIPVYYIFLITVIVIDRLVDLGINRTEIITSFTFTTGWFSDGTWMLGHTWSLSVEEQFYLLWPPILLLVKKPRLRIIFALAAISIFPVVRIAVYLSPLVERRSFIFITQGDAILYGCLLAMLMFYYSNKIAGYLTGSVLLSRIICISLIVLSGALQTNAILGVVTVPFSGTIEGLAIAWLIGSFIMNRDVVYTALNSRVIVFLGVISYSWYLWQQLFLFECGKYFPGNPLFSFPINLIASFAAAVASYYLIEKTFERAKRNFMMAQSGKVKNHGA